MEENVIKKELTNKEFMLKYAKYHKFREDVLKEMENNMTEIRAGIIIDLLISNGGLNDDICRKVLMEKEGE